MLTRIVDEIVVAWNLHMLTGKGKGSLKRTQEEYAFTLGSAGFWKGFSCYNVHYVFNKNGFIKSIDGILHAPFPEYCGNLRIAVNIVLPEKNERIVKIEYSKKTPEKIRERLIYSIREYNARYGFKEQEPGHDGFTLGDFLDDDPKQWLL